jgi:hypothetical protein
MVQSLLGLGEEGLGRSAARAGFGRRGRPGAWWSMHLGLLEQGRRRVLVGMRRVERMHLGLHRVRSLGCNNDKQLGEHLACMLTVLKVRVDVHRVLDGDLRAGGGP